MITADTVLTPAELVGQWRAFLDDPSLDELPEGLLRVEMDEYGELILSPRPANRHQIFAGLVCQQLHAALGGYASASELAVRTTSLGVRIPDAFWTASIQWAVEDPAPRAPEICVEIASKSNHPKWLARKAEAFIAAGAKEVIIVSVDGTSACYFHADGEHGASRFLQLRFPLLDSGAEDSGE